MAVHTILGTYRYVKVFDIGDMVSGIRYLYWYISYHNSFSLKGTFPEIATTTAKLGLTFTFRDINS